MSNQNVETTYSDASYWDERWKNNDIQFHKATNHPFLVKHLDKFTKDRTNIRLFFPFCGKEVDMAWLASLGHEIVGVEFVQAACEQFFQENNLKYSVTDIKDFKLFISEDKKIKIYNGDFFKFTSEYEGLFECIWDRGALVALPVDLRIKYSQYIQTLLNKEFSYLLDTYDYDQELYPGPPHSVKLEEVVSLYGLNCKIEQLECELHQRAFNEKLETNKPYEKLYLLTNK